MNTRLVRNATAMAWVCSALCMAAPMTYELAGYASQDPCVDSVRFALMTLKNQKFYSKGDRLRVNVLTNRPGSTLTYKVWLQKQPAPLVVLIPGLGGHCASLAPAVLAEALFNHGLSILVVSSPFNWDFVQNGSSTMVPGFTPQDARDLYDALQVILANVDKDYGAGRVTRKLLVGYSLGALDALFISDLDAHEQRLQFERIVAVSPPVNLLYGLKQLDDYYLAWTNLARAGIEKKKDDVVGFYEKQIRTPQTPEAGASNVVPVTSDEAQMAVGMVFHRSLGEVIKAIHERKDFGFLKTPYKSNRTRFLEKEIERFNYANYLMTFVKAAHSNVWKDGFTSKDLNKRASLPAIQASLASNDRVRVIHSRDDILLTEYDRSWLGTVLGERVVFLDHGGHLGFLYRDDVLEFIACQLGHGTNPLREASAPVLVAALPPAAAATNGPSAGPATNEPALTAARVTVTRLPATGSAETTATIEMEDTAGDALVQTGHVVAARLALGTNAPARVVIEPVSNKAATVEYYDAPGGTISNAGGRSDITIEYYGH